MPFKVVNGPATFQEYINSTLYDSLDLFSTPYDSLDLFCIAYLDNILIYLKNAKMHIQNVRKVLEYLLKYKLFVKLEKCVFNISKISFLDVVFMTDGVKMDPSQVLTIEKWLMPKSFCNI